MILTILFIMERIVLVNLALITKVVYSEFSVQKYSLYVLIVNKLSINIEITYVNICNLNQPIFVMCWLRCEVHVHVPPRWCDLTCVHIISSWNIRSFGKNALPKNVILQSVVAFHLISENTSSIL